MTNGYAYTYLITAGQNQDIPVPAYLEWLPGKLGNYFREKYLYKKLPVRKERMEVLQVEGQKLTLPYTYESLKKFPKEDITNILNRIIMREGVQNIVVEKKLEPYLDDSLLIDGRLLPYLMIREGTEWICNRHHIDRRGFQPVVVDSGDSDTEYVLAQIGQDLNFLTILTSRPEFFEDYVEQLYAQTGLMASVLTKPLYGQIQGNVVLDLNKAADRDYRYYPQNAIVLELTGMEKKRRDIMAKRRDITFYNRFDIADRDKIIDNRLLQAALCGECTWISKCELESMRPEAEEFHLKIRRLSSEMR